MLSRICVTRSILQSNCLLKTPVPQQFIPRNYLARDYSRPARTRIQSKTGPTLWERAMAPAGPNAFSLGKGALAGASALALGSLCYYGVFSSKPGIVQEAYVWPQYVKDRIKTTYGYIGGSLALTAASAAAVFRSPTMLNLVARNGWMSVIATLALMIGSGMVARSIEYQPGFGGKQLAWMLHTGIVGAVIAPMCFLGGPIIIRAAWYTAGVVGGLSTVAVCAPSGEFLNLGAPLAMGLGAVFAASLASMFLPPTTALGAGLYSLSLYGGLILFSGFLLYDTQKIIKRAETHPAYSIQQYDPINAAMSVYMDTINIFIRIASILAGGGSRRK